MPPNARFRVASVTKMFVATVVLQLVAEGKLRLDEPIGRVLVGQVFGAGTVTLRELLNHTSGFYDGGPLVPVPGTFHYDNTNYALLGEVVEAVTGMTVRQALVLRVFRPLRLAGTLWPTSATPPRLARGYSPRGADVTPLAPQELSSADAIVSTADDLRRFVTALVSGRLLAPEQLAEMEAAVDVGKPYRPIDDRYGLGLMRYESTCGSIWGHRGRIAGYTTFAFASPFGPRSVVVLLNVGRVSDAAVVRLNSLVFAALCA